jgi:hypothetical protein
MQRWIKGMVAAGALTIALALPAGAGARTQWICDVDGQSVVFVSAGDAARHGLEQANSRAGVVFENQFGEENCRIE